MADRLGLVFLLDFGALKLVSRRSKNFWTTNSLFLCWLRVSSFCSKRRLSLVSLWASFLRSLVFSSSLRVLEFCRSKVSSTLEETLLTCWPPAPLLRTALNFNSRIISSLFNFYCYYLRRWLMVSKAMFRNTSFWGGRNSGEWKRILCSPDIPSTKKWLPIK